MREPDVVANWLVERIAVLTGVDPTSIPWDTPFAELGLSSIQAIELSDDLQRWTNVELPSTLAFDYPTIEVAAGYVAEEADKDRARERRVAGEEALR